MKTRFFFLLVLFLGIGALTYAQTQTAAPATSKEAPAVVATPDNAKTGDCTGHSTTGAKMDCKWVDANSDGKCDGCGHTEKECKEACKPAAPKPTTTGCQFQKECGKASSSCTSKDGKK